MGIYRNWLLACRPWSFTMTVISLSVGAAMAARDGAFSWALYLLTLSGMLALAAAVNFMNDYYDVLSGVDTLDVSTAQYRPHPLLEGKLKPRPVLIASYLLNGIGVVVGLYLAATRGWWILVIGLIGIIASIGYTAPPLKYKYRGLGEIAGFFVWGPLVVEGAYYVQRQAFSEAAFFVSLPFGGLMMTIFISNNLRDLEHDKVDGIFTLPTLIGKRNALCLYATLVALCYLAFLLMSLFGPLPIWSLIVMLSLPLPYQVLRDMFREIPKNADARTARMFNACGVLLVSSLILAKLF